MKMLILFVLTLSVSVSIASAVDLSYVEQGSYIIFDNEDGTYLNLTGQQNFSEFNFVGSTLNITINNSYSTYANTANIVLSNISYLNDKLNFTASGTSGVLSISAKMIEDNVYYLLKVDNVPNSYNFSTDAGVVFYSWSTWSQHEFSIDLATPAAPIISIVNNTKTNNTATSKIFINNLESIAFYANANQPVTTWNWSVDNVQQSNNFDYLAASWSKGKYHYVSLSASNEYGTSNVLTWGINVFPAMATATIGALNETPADEIMTALENKDAPALVLATVLPFTNLMGAFFYAIVWFTVFVMMWIKQKSMNIPMVVGIIFGGLIISFLPEQYQLVTTALIVLGIFAVIYIFFKGRG